MMKFVASHTYGAASGSEERLAQGGMRFRRSEESDEMERDSYRAPWRDTICTRFSKR